MATPLAKILQDHPQNSLFGSFSALKLLQEHWHLVMGDKLAAKTRPIRLENGFLTIAVLDAAYGQAVSYHQKVILDLVDSLGIDPKLVDKIRTQTMATMPTPAKQKPEEPMQKPRPLPPMFLEKAQEAASCITNPWVRAHFAKLMAKRLETDLGVL